jgi:AraC family transcriptional regulator of adaptative response/methylated-DNA-[protein]-cysteine methyltransferase
MQTYHNANHTTPAEDAMWQAVLSRDTASGADFVYAVRSTGIYCRPNCPSRRPRREQVEFFPIPEEAERAGFRPCNRCRPRDRDAQVELVRQACHLIEESLDGSPTLAALARQLAVSPHHLQRTFKRITGVTPRQYADARRLEGFKTGLKQGDSVTTALYDAGYGSSSRLYERAPAQLGMTPTAYRRGGAGMRISYTIVDCPLGRLLVAATDRGVCAVYLGSNDAFLASTLYHEFPKSEISCDGQELGRWIAPLLVHLDGRQPHLDLPLDVQATAFQRRVWEELRAIPYGSTRTYGEIARSLGQPSAARAVGRACATNPTSVVVPCHRAVRGDGGLGGYRWGLERKRALLDQERDVRATSMANPDVEAITGAA